jgi:hypothetical protein
MKLSIAAAPLLPPPEILVSQWADENRVLTGGAAAGANGARAITSASQWTFSALGTRAGK